MIEKQPEALRLATALTEHVEYYGDEFSEEKGCLAAAELRRLHEVNQELLEALLDLQRQYKYVTEFMDWGKARAAIAKATGVTKE